MNPSDPLNLNNNVYSDQNLLFQPDFLNVEYFFNKIYLFLKNFSNADPTPSATTSGAVDSGLHFVVVGGIVKSLLYFILVFLITVIAYCIIRLFEIRKKEHEHLAHEIAEFAHKKKEHEEKAQGVESGRIKNEKWEKWGSPLFLQKLCPNIFIPCLKRGKWG